MNFLKKLILRKLLKPIKILSIFVITSFSLFINLSTSSLYSQNLILEKNSALVAKIPWQTGSYKLPLHGSGKLFFGPRKLLVKPNGNFCVVFTQGIYVFDPVGKFLKSINNLDGGIYDAESYSDGSVCVLLDDRQTIKGKGVKSIIYDKSWNKASEERITAPGGGGDKFSIAFHNGDISYHDSRMKKTEKIKSLFSDHDFEKEKNYFEKNYELPELSGKENWAITKKISDITDKKIWASVFLPLGKGHGNLYGFLNAVKDGRTAHYGIYVQNINSKRWQFFLFPPEKDYYASAYIFPGIGANGDVFYLFDKPDGMEIYHLPILW